LKNISNAVKVGILFVFMAGGSYGVWKSLGEGPAGEGALEVWAHYRDAQGLPEGSRVVVAGLPVGEIARLSIDGRYARVTMRLRDEVVLWSNAVAMKKSSSLLGDFYIELDPGTEFSLDADGKRVSNQKLGTGDQVANVVEATSPDALLRRIEESMPKVDAVLLSVRDLSEDVRALVNGPVGSMANRLERLVAEQSEVVESALARADSALARIDLITRDVRNVTQGADEKVNSILDNIDEASAEARTLITSTRSEIEQTAVSLREKLDLVDEFMLQSTNVVEKVNQPNSGTLGRLVNDTTLADNVEDITEDLRGFTGTLFGLQSYVGLRTEYNVFSGGVNSYVTVRLYTRPDKFYLIEFNRGPRGGFAETELVIDPIRNGEESQFSRRIFIRDETRVTFQIAKRIDWLTLRAGIKDSSGGFGVDGQWFDDRLTLQVDAFDASFDRFPRVKVSAAFELFAHVYVLAGIDDALNEPTTLTFPDAQEGIADFFQEVRFGRDLFLGGIIKFNDLDLTALLTIGSGLVLAAAE